MPAHVPIFTNASDPTVNDDGANTSGNGIFIVGHNWINTTTNESFECMDDSTGAAVWKPLTATVSQDTNTAQQALGAVYAVLTSMTRSLPAGTYTISFSGWFMIGGGDELSVAIFSGGSEVGGADGYTMRKAGNIAQSPDAPIQTQAVVTLTSTTTVDVRGREDAGTDITFETGNMIIVKH